LVSPIEYIGDDDKTGEKFVLGTDKNQSIALTYYPYLDKTKLNNSGVVTAGENHNPFYGKYNPNFSGCYQPIIVEGKGKARYFDGSETVIYEGDISQDISGIPYCYKYFEDTNSDGIKEEFEVRKNSTPYFFNRTNYHNNNKYPLQDYDPVRYPVFEYYQYKNRIYFNDNLNNYGDNNEAEIIVKYKYLIECLRLKIIMYRNIKHNYGLTPIVRSYAIKTKPFK